MSERKARQARKEMRAKGVIPKCNLPRVWTRRDEARYNDFNSIKKVKVPGLLGVMDEKIMHKGRIVSERYVKRMAKRELFDMQVRAKRRNDAKRQGKADEV